MYNVPGYIGGKPFKEAIVANCAAIDSYDVIFCCCKLFCKRSLTVFEAVLADTEFWISVSEHSLESLSDSIDI